VRRSPEELGRELVLRERQIDALTAAVERAEDERATAVAKAEERADALRLARDRSEAAQRRVAVLESELSVLSAVRGAAEARLVEAERALAAERAARASADERLAGAEAELRRLEEESRLARDRAEADSAALREIVDSRSWRLTKPMRVVVRAFGGRQGGDR